jgi:hypothetical protein
MNTTAQINDAIINSTATPSLSPEQTNNTITENVNNNETSTTTHPIGNVNETSVNDKITPTANTTTTPSPVNNNNTKNTTMAERNRTNSAQRNKNIPATLSKNSKNNTIVKKTQTTTTSIKENNNTITSSSMNTKNGTMAENTQRNHNKTTLSHSFTQQEIKKPLTRNTNTTKVTNSQKIRISSNPNNNATIPNSINKNATESSVFSQRSRIRTENNKINKNNQTEHIPQSRNEQRNSTKEKEKENNASVSLKEDRTAALERTLKALKEENKVLSLLQNDLSPNEHNKSDKNVLKAKENKVLFSVFIIIFLFSFVYLLLLLKIYYYSCYFYYFYYFFILIVIIYQTISSHVYSVFKTGLPFFATGFLLAGLILLIVVRVLRIRVFSYFLSHSSSLLKDHKNNSPSMKSSSNSKQPDEEAVFPVLISCHLTFILTGTSVSFSFGGQAESSKE